MITHKPQALSKANIFLSCTEEKYYNNEMIVEKNTLIRMLSGGMKIILPGTTYVIGAGDTIFFPRNELAKVVKVPKDGRPYKSVAIYFTTEAMQQYFLQHAIKPKHNQCRPGIKLMDKHPLLESLFNSLLPYFEMKSDLPSGIANGKVDEAISILRSIDEDLFNVISNFEEPGKINLSEFMEKNYMFNMPVEKFGYLTGRSLTTFKRDFKKTFNTTPQRWLTERRLGLAYHQISDLNKRPVDVCYESGFENLSHFSYAFKKQYGINPTELVRNAAIKNHLNF
jgi:AraC family transcriptional regulator, exoenzyme S synthesis regulatory protein ExsA